MHNAVENFNSINVSALSKYTDKKHIFVGECHLDKTNTLFQSVITSYYLRNGFNALVIERGYGESYLLTKAIKEKDKKLIKKIGYWDIWIDENLYFNIMDSLSLLSIPPPKIIGIDYEQSFELTKMALNDIFTSCGLVKDASEQDSSNYILDFDKNTLKLFYNDTIIHYYHLINHFEDYSTQSVDSMYNDLVNNSNRYKSLFKDKYDDAVRCLISFKMMRYSNCRDAKNVTSCYNEREKLLYKNFVEFVENDSLRSIGLFGYRHILKKYIPCDGYMFNYAPFVSQLCELKNNIASFFPFYDFRSYKNWIIKDPEVFMDINKYLLLKSKMPKKSFVIFEQPKDGNWELNRSLYDLIIISGK